jgi:aryl-alcohol dehydrogenase-like predicted oxidoreductase
MKRRDFLRGTTAASLLSVLDPAYLAAKEQLTAGRPPQGTLERRKYGRTDERLSIIGFGGIIVMNATPAEASEHVAAAVDRGVNYFDVAPSYGNAQDRLGPALKPHRDNCFLACKTAKRDAAGAREELETSLKLLQTDHFDLYQLHALTKVEEVDQAFAAGGAMEPILQAKQEGKIRYVGFSAHDQDAALAALERFDFDSILFPLGFPTWIKGEFGPAVHQKAHDAGRGILALKAMAHRKWPAPGRPTDSRWQKAWYEPFDDVDKVALGLRFTLHLPVTAMLTPGHWELFTMALDLAQAGALTPLNDNERKVAAEIASTSDPIFTRHV